MKTKKTLATLLILIIISSGCKKQTFAQITQHKGNIEQHTYGELLTNNTNPKDSIKQTFLNNTNEKQSPVKITASKLFYNQYTNHKDIKIAYKNISKKDIQAMKIEWYCENSFNEPAHGKFFYIQGKSSENITRLLKAGAARSQLWEDFSTDANTIIKVRAYYVLFTDGTTWTLNP